MLRVSGRHGRRVTGLRRFANTSILFNLFIIASCILNTSSCSAVSWEDEKKSWEERARSSTYRDPGYAARLAFSPFPIDIGHFYIGDVKRGVWTTVGEVFCATALAAGALDANGRSKKGNDPVWTSVNTALTASGLGGLMGLKVWSSFDAAERAVEFNRQNGNASAVVEQSRLYGIAATFRF